MADLDFPSSPVNGQTYTLNGVQYNYNSTIGAWLTYLLQNPVNANTTNTQIVFNDAGYLSSTNGMTFNKTANTVYFNQVNAAANVVAQYFVGNGSTLTGVLTTLSPAYNTANAAFARGNTSAQLAFFRVASNGTNLDAASNADTLTISSSNNIVLIANSTNDSLQITQSPSGVTSGAYSSGISALTVDAYGRITAVTGSAGYVTSSGVTSVASGTGLTGGTITTTGTLSVNFATVATVTNAAAAFAKANAALQNTNVTLAGTLTTTGNITAPAFYDSNDSNFYLNPNGGSQVQGHFRIGPYASSSTTGNQTNLELMNNGGTGDGNLAGISFHCTGSYGMHMHLRADGYFGAGGWSASAWRWYVNMGNGDMTAAGNVTAYSDPRLKEEIVNIDSALQKILTLNGVKFKWKNESILGRPGTYDYGILANEVQEVAPELVADSAHDTPEGDKYKTVAYDKLVPFLIEAIKEQQKQIDELKCLLNNPK